LYEHKYAEVKSTYYHGWMVNLNIVDKYGKTLHKYSSQFREKEWEELCQIFTWIEHKHQECIQLKEEEKKKRKAFIDEFEANHKKMALMYSWSCLQDTSQNFFFTEEHAKQDAMRNTQKEHQESIQIKKMPVPQQYEVHEFLKFAFAFVWAEEYLKLRTELSVPECKDLDWKVSMEAVQVKKEIIRTLFVQFFLAQGLPVEDFDKEWEKLQNYGSKPELQTVANSLVNNKKLDDVNPSPVYMLCDEVYKGLHQGKPAVPSPVKEPFPKLLIDQDGVFEVDNDNPQDLDEVDSKLPSLQ